MRAGQPHGIEPAGLDALDVTRIEAGFILNGVDYFSAHQCVLESRKSTPVELGLGWTVDRSTAEPTSSAATALRAESERGSAWPLVGLEVSTGTSYEALYDELRPAAQRCRSRRVPRSGLPVYDDDGRQVGQVTSHTWSPILKKYLALAVVSARARRHRGTRLQHRVTVEYERRKVARHRRRRRRSSTRRGSASHDRQKRAGALEYDAIIVGGGHNGLVCAAYLAKAGRKVLVLERRHLVGGATVTEELYPGFKFSVCSYVVSLLRPWHHPRPRAAAVRPRAHPARVLVHAAPRRPLRCAAGPTRSTRGARSRASARATPRATRSSAWRWRELARFAKHVIDDAAPDPTSLRPRTCCRCSRLGRALREPRRRRSATSAKLMTMSAADFLDEWFESRRAQGADVGAAASSAPSSASARPAPPTCCSTTTWARSTARSAPGASPRAAPAR